MTYADKNQALTGKYENTPYYELLNGTWKFWPYGLYLESACRRCLLVKCEPEGWHDIKVPGKLGSASIFRYGLFIRITDMSFNPRNLKSLAGEESSGVPWRDITANSLQNARAVIFTPCRKLQNPRCYACGL